jgi:hypothetical protein
MTKTNKPRMVTTKNGGYVELNDDGVRIAWSCEGGKWQVSISSSSGIDVTGVRHEKATIPSLH